jgi:hypothetical protein
MDVQLQACALATPPGTRHAHPLPVAPRAPRAPRPSPLAPRPSPLAPRPSPGTLRPPDRGLHGACTRRG